MKRVTVSLEPEVAAWTDIAAREQDRSFSAVVNATLRSALVKASLDRLGQGDPKETLETAYEAMDYVQQAERDHARRHRGGAA